MKKTKKNKQPKTTRIRNKRISIVYGIDDLYKIINKVQIKHKKRVFLIKDISLGPVIENVIKDSSLFCEKKEQNNQSVIYTLLPNREYFEREVDFEKMEKELFS